MVLALAALGGSGQSVSPCHARILQEAAIFVKGNSDLPRH